MRSLLVLLFVCTSSAFAAPRIESVSVKPNPVPFKGEQTPEVVTSVTIERPTPLDLMCEASVDPGDGSTYKLAVTGSGRDACVGKREVMVTVGGSAAAAPKAEAAAAQCPRGWTMAKGATAERFTCEKAK